MSAHSTIDYLPFDPDALAAFSSNQLNLCCIAAFITLLLYDHAITLDREVEWIWTLKWGLPKIIFFINRYIVSSLILVHSVPDYIFPLPISFCQFQRKLAWLSVFTFAIAELLLVIRVCSLYGHRKLIVWLLGSLFVLTQIGGTVLQQLYARTYHTSLGYKFLPGCWQWTTNASMVDYSWALLLAFEGTLMVLTIYKLKSYRNQMNPTITLLARDSIIYFLVIAAFLALAVALQFPIAASTLSVMIPGQCVASVAVGRMMMNLRGLIADDPEHNLHLQTLQFMTLTQSSAETEND